MCHLLTEKYKIKNIKVGLCQSLIWIDSPLTI